MDNVNRIIFWILIPIVLAFFLVFRVAEWRLADDGGREKYAEQHVANINSKNDIDCLVIGGSNAVFSLSAEQMSDESNLTCYNLSLLNEGFSDVAHFDFIRNLQIEKDDIKSIIYSTVYPLTRDGFELRLEYNQNETPIVGVTEFQLIGKSIASYLKDLLEGKPLFNVKQYPTPNSHGDFRFELYDGCDNTSIIVDWVPVTVDDALKDWLKNNIQVVKGLFPNAEITFVLPSTMRTNLNEEIFDNFSNSLQAEVHRQSIRYIEQSQFDDINLLCDGVPHTNALGRERRTSELLLLMQASN
jgi:hypothetical protein